MRIKEYNEYLSVRIKPLNMVGKSYLYYAMSFLKYGFFAWEHSKNTVFVNEEVANIFNIDFSSNPKVGKVLVKSVEENYIRDFLQHLMQIKLDKESKSFEFPIKTTKGVQWYNCKLVFMQEEDVTVGLLEESESSKESDFLLDTNNEELLSLLSAIPQPIFYRNDKLEKIFENTKGNSRFDILHSIAVKYLQTGQLHYADYNWIQSYELYDSYDNSNVFNINFSIMNTIYHILLTTKK
jgi:hypothetical protein